MNVKVKIELDRGAIQALEKAIEVSAEQAAEAVHTDVNMSTVVPKNTGELERSGFVRKSKTRFAITYDTPYARKLYWHPEYNFRTDKNPNAQGLWMQTYVDGDKKMFFSEAFSKFLRINAKGLIK